MSSSAIAYKSYKSFRWEKKKLADLGKLFCGQSPSTKDVNTLGVGTVYITGPEQWNGLKVHCSKWTTNPKRVVPAGCIFITVKGAGVGKTFPGIPCAIGRDVYAFKPNNDLSEKFIYWAIIYSVQDVIRHAVGDIPGISKSHILDHEIFMPRTIEEQQAIVGEIEKQFSRLDEAVANLKRVKANLKRYKAAVLKAAVEGKLNEEWRKQHPDVEPAAKLLERILEERRASWQGRGKYKEPVAPDMSGLPELPEGWVWASVSDLLAEPIVNGLSIKESAIPTAVRALRLSAMSDDGLDYNDYRFLPAKLDQVSDIIIREGDFFVSRGNGSLHLVGRSTVAQCPPFDVIFPDTMMRLRLAKTIRATFWLQAIWSSQIVRNQIERRVKTTAGIYKISQPELASITIPLPPFEEQQRIIVEIERRLSIIAGAQGQVEANLRRAERLRQSILKQAFSGQLVSQDPNDEPASGLLKRIRNGVGAIHESPSRAMRKQNRAINESPLRQQQPTEPVGAIHELPLQTSPAKSNLKSHDAVIAAILDHMQPDRKYSRADIADALGLSAGGWNAAIQELKRRGKVRQEGERRGARYALVSDGKLFILKETVKNGSDWP